jgi:hypothetical protein
MNPFYVLKIKSNESNRTNMFYWMTPGENYRLRAMYPDLDKFQYTHVDQNLNCFFCA